MRRRIIRWAWRGASAAFGFGLLGAVALAVAVYAFPYAAEELSPDRAAPLRIFDRHGALLRAMPAHDGSPGRHGGITLDLVAPAAVQTVLASEDRRFFEH